MHAFTASQAIPLLKTHVSCPATIPVLAFASSADQSSLSHLTHPGYPSSPQPTAISWLEILSLRRRIFFVPLISSYAIVIRGRPGRLRISFLLDSGYPENLCRIPCLSSPKRPSLSVKRPIKNRPASERIEHPPRTVLVRLFARAYKENWRSKRPLPAKKKKGAERYRPRASQSFYVLAPLPKKKEKTANTICNAETFALNLRKGIAAAFCTPLCKCDCSPLRVIHCWLFLVPVS